MVTRLMGDWMLVQLYRRQHRHAVLTKDHLAQCTDMAGAMEGLNIKPKAGDLLSPSTRKPRRVSSSDYEMMKTRRLSGGSHSGSPMHSPAWKDNEKQRRQSDKSLERSKSPNVLGVADRPKRSSDPSAGSARQLSFKNISGSSKKYTVQDGDKQDDDDGEQDDEQDAEMTKPPKRKKDEWIGKSKSTL
eukprot:TRINITY_DN3465_c0_g1_i3.p1 TRINITY_DN3465_c0_g1~~TRINITY_DN3465_c0_g1_i3.p1  ORF type:complete len:188 (-),score=37.64 TRINITY_DN3465_c0_g1_i3:39-602(-)